MVGRHFRWAILLALTSTAITRADEPAGQSQDVEAEHSEQMAAGLAIFKSQVRGIFVEQCVRCHGGEDTEGEFDLTTRQALLRGGAEGAAFEIGKAKSSRLYELITHAEEPEMPMDASKLPDDQIAAIARWIDLGAPYDKPLMEPQAAEAPWTERIVPEEAKRYWAFQPLAQHEPPQVKDAKWIRGDPDRFILAALERRAITPNPLAEKRDLVRRANFDLLGLPPTPEEVDQFIADTRPDAYARLIDRLLESPHYGERWGRHWLDIARFAESHGFEQDYDRPHAYHYRDFVIKALNMDMPYDRFVRWQLAGDELAPDDPLAMMATGFLGAGVFPTQLTEREFEPARYDELADMVGTMGTAMLGMTIACARCHDHKFDPIPQADFYRLAASFTTTIRSEIDIELPVKDMEAFERQHQPLVDALDAYEREQAPAKAKAWLSKLRPEAESPATWHVLEFTDARSEGGATLTPQEDGSLVASGMSPPNDSYEFVARTNRVGITAIRLEALSHPSLVKGGPGRASNGNFALSDFKVTAAPVQGDVDPIDVRLTGARATFEQNNASLSIAASIDNDPVSGWAVDPQFGKDHAAAFDLATPVGFEGGTVLTFTLHFNNNVQHSIGRPRLAISTQASPPLDGEAQEKQLSNAELLQLVNDAGGFDSLPESDRRLVLGRYTSTDEKWLALKTAVDTSWNDRPQAEKLKVMVTSEGLKPLKHHADGRGFTHFFKDTYFLKRGDTTQKQGVATQGFMQALMTAPDGEKHWQVTPPPGARTSYRRRALANWITDPEHGAGHLLARVIVNRLWQHHFGRGIVATPDDFGVQGVPPTHPELLDWLAVKLIENGWRLKPMQKLMMTSAAYMQSSQFNNVAAQADPQNLLSWRFNVRRLEAEVIRDSMLAISGQLDPAMFGKGALDEGMQRRSVYFFVKRSKVIPMMQLFDSPESLVSIGDRPRTTIAPQALMFMNSPQVRSYVRAFAAQLAATAATGSREAAIRQGYQAAIARDPTPEETARIAGFLDEQTKSYRADHQPNPEQLALADVCQVLFSLNEFIYVE